MKKILCYSMVGTFLVGNIFLQPLYQVQASTQSVNLAQTMSSTQSIQFNLSSLDTQTDQAITSGNFTVHFNNLTTWLNENTGSISPDNMKNKLNDAVFARVLAQWKLLSQTGVSSMNTFSTTQNRQNFLKQFMKDTNVMNTFLEGGKPAGQNPVKSLEIFEEIWRTDADSHSGLYLKLAIATSLAHAKPVISWTTNTTINPLERYQHFKAANENNELFPSFRTASIYDLRRVVEVRVENTDLTWARTKIRESRPDLNSQQKIGDSFLMVNYTDKNPNGVDIQSGVEKFYGMPFTLARVLEYGGVCGSLSTFGSSVTQAFGVPAETIGQPGHCAFVWKNSPTSWVIGNDISGWGSSETDQGRVLWAADRVSEIAPHEPAYLLLLENAYSRPTELSQSERIRWIANALTSQDNAMNVLKVARDIQPLNILVWRDYINCMNGSPNVTNAQWQTLSRDILNTFPQHLFPMLDLIYSIKNHIVNESDETQQYVKDLDNAIEAVTDQAQKQIKSKVIEGKERIGLINKELILRSQMSIYEVTSQHDTSSNAATNAIDGNDSTLWHTKWDLSDKLPQSVTIKLDRSRNVNKLDYRPRQDGCDNGNVTGYNIYTRNDGEPFKLVASGNWNLDKTLKSATFSTQNAQYVKFEATTGYGGFASAAEIRLYQDLLIPQSKMKATATSEETVAANNAASCAIDGNPSTIWHNKWSGADVLPQSITLNLGGTYSVDKIKCLPRQDGVPNGNIAEYIIYTSTDGINFNEATRGTWITDNTEKIAKFTATNASYVRLTVVRASNGFASAAEINVYGR